MQFRHPAAVIDETVKDLEYLIDFFLDDIEHGELDGDQLSAPAMRAVAALEGARVMLPRLRIFRSNYVTDSRLPDARAGAGLLALPSQEETKDAFETPAAARHPGVVG